MSFDALGELNWLAVIVATLVWFALGALWYSTVLFGKAWMRSVGMTSMPEQRPGPGIYLFPLIAYFVAVVATAMIAAATGSESVGEGIVLGLVIGVGFAVAFYAVEAVFGQRPEPGTWFLISAAYQFIGLLVAAIIVTVWD